MRMLGTIDLEILQLAAAHNKKITDSVIENSDLKRLGVGKILDALASLRDRELLTLDSKNGSFTMTDASYNILWSNTVPLAIRILRLLEIQSCSIQAISVSLNMKLDETLKTALIMLQREQYIIITPQIRNDKVEKIYEISDKGIQEITADNKDSKLWENTSAQDSDDTTNPLNMINEITRIISTSESITVQEQRLLLQKLSGLYDTLKRTVKIE